MTLFYCTECDEKHLFSVMVVIVVVVVVCVGGGWRGSCKSECDIREKFIRKNVRIY